MNELLHTPQKRVEALMPELRAMPQVDCKEKHYFGPGLYVREVTMPAGSVIVGKPHKTEHLCVMLQCRMKIVKYYGEVI